MASFVNFMGSGICYSPTVDKLKKQRQGRSIRLSARPNCIRAETVNPSIRKEEDKVVDTVLVSDLAKPLTAYCRCWRSATFPLCDGSHVKHNKATEDNVGPLLIKK